MNDAEVVAALEAVESAIAALGVLPPAAATAANEALTAVVRVYGEGLRRLMAELDGEGPGAVERAVGDELIAHLLLLHGLHPEPAASRLSSATANLAEELRGQGTDLELLGVSSDGARVRLTAAGCGSTAATLGLSVQEILLAAAPELASVEVETASLAGPAPVPVQLTTRPGTSVRSLPGAGP